MSVTLCTPNEHNADQWGWQLKSTNGKLSLSMKFGLLRKTTFRLWTLKKCKVHSLSEWWRGSATGTVLDFAISRSRVQILLEATPHNNLGQVVYTYVPRSPSSITFDYELWKLHQNMRFWDRCQIFWYSFRDCSVRRWIPFPALYTSMILFLKSAVPWSSALVPLVGFSIYTPKITPALLSQTPAILITNTSTTFTCFQFLRQNTAAPEKKQTFDNSQQHTVN